MAYFHVVFTLPQPVAAIAYQNKAVVYAILFEAAAETLRTIGAEIGVTMVLHTWGQTLTHHPHVHCIVPGGGLSPDASRWFDCRPGFFLPVRVLSRLFRRLFLTKLMAAHQSGKLRFSGDRAGLVFEASQKHPVAMSLSKQCGQFAPAVVSTGNDEDGTIAIHAI